MNDGRDHDGNLVYFEVSNIVLSRSEASSLVARLPGVEMVRKPKRFALYGDDEFCVFCWNGRTFTLWEPFGDNDRFHVAERPLGHSHELEQIRSAFQQYRSKWGAARWGVLALLCAWIAYQAYQVSHACDPCKNSHAVSGK